MKEALDIYELRAQLSQMAGRLAAASITRAQLAAAGCAGGEDGRGR